MVVAEVLAYRYPERDELILAGLLHDIGEDTDASFATLEARFGARVAHLVRAVSKDDEAMVTADARPIPPTPRTSEDEADLWRRRRAFMLQHLHGVGVDPDVLRLKAADAFVNLDAVMAGIGDEPLARDLSEVLTSVRAAS
jgi:(p)ppGpp synthase/HD superfamily hydrolase